MKQYKVFVDCPASVGEKKGHSLAFVTIAENAEHAKELVLQSPRLDYFATPEKITAVISHDPVCFMHERF